MDSLYARDWPPRGDFPGVGEGYPGSGSLAAKRTVEAYDGRADVESTSGLGSRPIAGTLRELKLEFEVEEAIEEEKMADVSPEGTVGMDTIEEEMDVDSIIEVEGVAEIDVIIEEVEIEAILETNEMVEIEGAIETSVVIEIELAIENRDSLEELEIPGEITVTFATIEDIEDIEE